MIGSALTAPNVCFPISSPYMMWSRVLAETTNYDDQFLFKAIKPLDNNEYTVFFADDSSVARSQIEKTLDALGVKHIGAINGRAAWDELQKIANHAESAGRRVRDIVQMVLTDVEMPEMDGYILTKHIKSDSRFTGVPVLMHSSLSSLSNQQLGISVGVDEYVSKFEPQRLADTVTRILRQSAAASAASAAAKSA